MRARILGLPLTLAILAVLGASACSARPEDPAAAIRAATIRAEAATSVRFAATMSYEGLTFDTSDLPTYATIEGAYDFGADRSMSRMQVGSEALESRTVDGTTYTRASLFGDEEEWLALPADGDLFGGDPIIGTPAAFLSCFDLETDVRRVGEETVGGRTTTRYTAMARDNVRLLEGLPDDATLDVWIDEDGYPVRVELRGPLTADEIEDNFGVTQDEPATFVLRMDFFDYDVPVAIEAPPDDQIRSSLGINHLNSIYIVGNELVDPGP